MYVIYFDISTPSPVTLFYFFLVNLFFLPTTFMSSFFPFVKNFN